MTSEEIAQLVALLRKLPESNLLPPNMPLDVWKAIHGIVPIPAVEVIVTTTGKNFLLTYRKDADWDGWHIPGGYMHYRESIPDACRRIAKQELGIDITFEKCIDAYMWPDHPYSSALSLVCICKTAGIPNTGEFFTEIPEKMIPHHWAFLSIYLG
ncbi:MAG: NUDIX hydrolase [Candidatus Peregrinibacteria bacterium Greene0416_62]|nr:MAG: NUDIX hydrolase [Candidatus Peregrinibacteria bacterium Greene0416_62]TSC96667.1 MAG: NUDIX hydrolase [Candidatus Peregrinibacteria bacterium Greene1014_49]